MLALYYAPGLASFLPHAMLREARVEFELRFIDRDNDAHKGEAYLKLNPNGLIPVLVDGDVVVFETAAIAMHIADKFPESGLAPAMGDADRSQFYKWMVHFTNTVQSEYRVWFYPDQHVLDPSAAATVKEAAGQRLNRMFDLISEQLGDKTWLLGDRFSAADLFLFMLIRWSRNMPRPARTLPNLNRLAERVLSRPGVQEALKVEGITAPFF